MLLLDPLTLLLIHLDQLSVLGLKRSNGLLLFALFLFKQQIDLLLRLKLKSQVVDGQDRLPFAFSTLRLFRVCLGSLAQLLPELVLYVHLNLGQPFLGFFL